LKGVDLVQVERMASEPGLDIHEWQTEWASLEDDLADSPETALPQVHELITRILTERQVLDESLVARDGAEPDSVRTWEAGRELVARLEDPDLEVERQDVIDQIEEYRALFEALLQERAAP
jgi:hypothetical protein